MAPCLVTYTGTRTGDPLKETQTFWYAHIVYVHVEPTTLR